MRPNSRIFFLLAGLWAVFAVPLWVLFYSGVILLPGPLDVFSWHAHELIFGYGGAVIAGFALTAIPNWTGRAPIKGPLLAALVLLWLGARVVAVYALIGSASLMQVATLDMGFLLVFLFFATFEIISSGNWRNAPILLIFGLFILGSYLAHRELLTFSTFWLKGNYLGLAALILLIIVIGGRIVPNFTRNWLKARGSDKLPATFDWIDKLTLIVSILALIGWLGGFGSGTMILLAFSAAILHFWRLGRWHGLHTVSEPMVFTMHVSYLWIPIGFLCIPLGQLGWINPLAGLHAWTIGAVGGMTLSIMTRATLGHSGRPIVAGGLTKLCFISIHLAAILRVLDGVLVVEGNALIEASSALWVVAYVLFLIGYTPLFFRNKA